MPQNSPPKTSFGRAVENGLGGALLGPEAGASVPRTSWARRPTSEHGQSQDFVWRCRAQARPTSPV